VQFEVGIQFGDAATETHMIQTYLNQGETCGFYMYYLDQYYYDFMAEMPCTGDGSTFIWPCSWPSLQCGVEDLTFTMKPYQHQVPIGGSLDFEKVFTNNSCEQLTIYDTLKVYRGQKLLKTFPFQWTIACGEQLTIYFALAVPKKDQFICWNLKLVDQGTAVGGSGSYDFSGEFDFHVEPGHKSMVSCP
jgi:hypothetical protein